MDSGLSLLLEGDKSCSHHGGVEICRMVTIDGLVLIVARVTNQILSAWKVPSSESMAHFHEDRLFS